MATTDAARADVRVDGGRAFLTPMMSATSVPNEVTADPQASPPSREVRYSTVTLRTVRFHAITERECIDGIMEAIARGEGGWVVTPNLDILRRCDASPTFRAMIEDADLVVADGMPLVWASRLQGTPLPERVAGSNLIVSLTEAAASQGRRVYLLGGEPGAADRAGAVLRERFPDLELAGTYCPPLGFEEDESEMARIRDRLLEAQPEIIYVALGSPKQEHLIRRFRDDLPGAWWLGVGVSLSFVSGHVKRAPTWIQRLGLEWVHRLAQEPRRLARRYLIDGIPFGLRLLASSLARRRTRDGRTP